MTIHKLAAGSGYEYLTRQVAAGDTTELGSTALADYYEAKGEAPGPAPRRLRTLRRRGHHRSTTGAR
ncbi:hypothetical protein ACIA03_00490 [Nocardioides sp. NPDC051685]|uniref:hypothetical protein n=1 Tax=Nocardioides sp. NPDC051685 TaxID=3364334 RepID=UPI0037A58F83